MTLGEATGVAERIRQSSTNGNREYWAWTIEQLVARAESLEAILRPIAAYDGKEDPPSYAKIEEWADLAAQALK